MAAMTPHASRLLIAGKVSFEKLQSYFQGFGLKIMHITAKAKKIQVLRVRDG